MEMDALLKSCTLAHYDELSSIGMLRRVGQLLLFLLKATEGRICLRLFDNVACYDVVGVDGPEKVVIV